MTATLARSKLRDCTTKAFRSYVLADFDRRIAEGMEPDAAFNWCVEEWAL